MHFHCESFLMCSESQLLTFTFHTVWKCVWKVRVETSLRYLCNPIKPERNWNVKLNSVSRRDRRRNCIYSKYRDKQCFNNLYLSRDGFCWVRSLTRPCALTPGSCHTRTCRRPPAPRCNLWSGSAEANTMLRSLLVRQSNNCIKIGIILSASQRCPLAAERKHSLLLCASVCWTEARS